MARVDSSVIGRGTGRRDRRANATGLIRPPGHARRELVGPLAAEHEVAVAVDEAGQHAATAGVDPFVCRRRCTGADRLDQPVGHHHPGIVQLAGRAGVERASLVISRAMLSTTIDRPLTTTPV